MTMIEKVARALCIEEGGDPDGQWKIWEGRARAAIEAMREPTQAMIEAAQRDAFGRYDYELTTYDVMIDAALADAV